MRALRRVLAADCRRMAALTVIGCAVLLVFEYPATLWSTPAPDVRAITVLRLALMESAMLVLLWGLLLLPASIALALGARLVVCASAARGQARERALSWPGLWAVRGRAHPGVRPLAVWMWAGALAAGLFLMLSTYVAYRAITYFKEPQLTAFLIASVQLALVALTLALGFLAARVVRFLADKLDPRLGRANPLGRVGPAGLLMCVLALVGLQIAVTIMPQLEPRVPYRHFLAAAVLAQGMWAGSWLLARRGRLLPADPRRRRITLAAVALVVAFALPLTLLRVGADHETKSVAITGSPLMQSMVDMVREITDFDGDGYGFLLGENDCAPFDDAIHPLARDLPDNGVDEDCNGRDFSLSMLRAHAQGDGEYMEVPESFQRDWNFLLLTIDTVRYDHTGFGGYREAKGRDTTPNLDQLVERSVSFDFAQAPSAGTMASIPAILTSKFFHSGIALDESNIKPRMPPRMRPENLLISELLKEQGYYNGAIVSHQYFNDWGMEQGFDTYDNELGAKYAPYAVTSHELTDKALAWVARNHRREKWFLWVHYLDPHGRYVDHPGEPSFGTTEEDLYDGELRFTDKHIGRLLDELSRIPGADRTVVIITSDHGDAFNEHGFINHGQALYRELLHVPLIVYIPELPPRQVAGAVTPLDIFPTMADLAGVQSRDLSVEGKSLVPQLFYGKEEIDRVVFSETNWPRALRAAISSQYKLVYKLQANVYEFYDLQDDPWEKRNIYQRADKAALGHMKEQLDAWLERVYYARDPVMNQAEGVRLQYLAAAGQAPAIAPAGDISFDQGRIHVRGMDSAQTPVRAGDKLEITVYFEVTGQPSADFRLQVELWPVAGNPGAPVPASPAAVTSPLKTTASGLFPSSRWRPGETVRDHFPVKVPKGWSAGERVAVGLRVVENESKKNVTIEGPTKPGNAHLALLGELPLEPAPAAPAQPAQPAGPAQKTETPTEKPAPAAPMKQPQPGQTDK